MGARAVGAVLAAALGLASFAARADDPAATIAWPAPAAVVAKVNGRPIHVSEVREALEAILQGRPVDDQSHALLQAEVLAQLIDRRLAEDVLKRLGLTTSEKEIQAAKDKLKTQLDQQKLSLAQFLAQRNQSEATLHDQLAWQLAWEKYLEKHLTDELLETYFKEHRQEFDGTEVRAAHILFRPDHSGDAAAKSRLIERAAQLRDEIAAGKISFDDAVQKYSDGPSRAKGGDLGFFPIQGVMDEAFSHAAFALKPGEISPPVITVFGVHLIRVSDVKPGGKDWTEVHDQLKAPAARELYDKLAKRERGKAKIEFTSALAHFKPATRDLVPASSAKEKP